MTDLTIPDEAWAAAADAFENTAAKFAAEPWYTADVNDVMSDAAIGSVKAAAPLIIAAELRRLAQPYADDSVRERQRANRLANGAPKWQYEASITSYQELCATARRLRARADELDPAGAK